MALTPELELELRDAKERAGSFLGAAKVAAFNGWSVGFFAVVSILFGLFSLTSFLVGVGLAFVARNEFIGRARLRSLDQSGLELLWRNQLGFMALIIAYMFVEHLPYRCRAHPPNIGGLNAATRRRRGGSLPVGDPDVVCSGDRSDWDLPGPQRAVLLRSGLDASGLYARYPTMGVGSAARDGGGVGRYRDVPPLKRAPSASRSTSIPRR